MDTEVESLNYVLLVSSCPPLSVGLTPPSSRYTHRTPRERDGPSRPRNQPGPPPLLPGARSFVGDAVSEGTDLPDLSGVFHLLVQVAPVPVLRLIQPRLDPRLGLASQVRSPAFQPPVSCNPLFRSDSHSSSAL